MQKKRVSAYLFDFILNFLLNSWRVVGSIMSLRLSSALLLDFLLLLLYKIEQLIIGIGPSGLLIFVML